MVQKKFCSDGLQNYLGFISINMFNFLVAPLKFIHVHRKKF